MIGLMSVALLFWGYHFTRIEIEFPESHADGLLVCLPEDNPDLYGLSYEEFNAARETYIEQFEQALSVSHNIDSRVLGIVRRNEFNVENRIDELADLITQYPDNRLTNLHFLNSCAEFAEHPACDESSVEQANFVNVDNAVSWSLLAVYKAEMEDEIGVDIAMARAAGAPEFNDYFSEQLRILHEAMPAGSNYERAGLVWNLIGRSYSIILNNGYQLAYLCNNDDPLRAGLHQSCLELGERMQLESQSLIMTMVGSGIQQGANLSMGNAEEAARLEQEYLSFSQNRSSPTSVWGQFSRISVLLTYDVNLTFFWLDNIIEFGESEIAAANTIEEARRLSANPNYSPCNPPSPRIYYN